MIRPLSIALALCAAAAPTDAQSGTTTRAAAQQAAAADSLYQAGRTALSRNDYRAAERYLAQAIDRARDERLTGDALYWRAFALTRLETRRDLGEAMRLLERQLEDFQQSSTLADARALRTRIEGRLARLGDEDAAASVQRTARGTSTQGAQGTQCPTGEDAEMRMAALDALMQMESSGALPVLKQLLARRDECSAPLRRKAMFIVAQNRSSEAADILLDAARNDPDREVRGQAVHWLSEVKSDRAVTALDSILRGARDADLQEKAIFALAQQRSARAHESLRQFAESNAPEALRGKAIFWLGQEGRRNPENAAWMRQLFGRIQGEELQGQIMHAMSEMGGEDNLRWMLSIAQDAKRPIEVRKKALFWAGQQRSVNVALIIPLYESSTDREMKEHVIWVLSERREPAATDKLLDIARTDKDLDMRKKAMFWLAQKNDPRVRQLLIDIINKPS